MDNQELRKKVQQLVKKYSLEIIHLDGLESKFKLANSQSLIFTNKKQELGWLQYSYVSSRFCENKSIFGFYISVGFKMDGFSVEDVPEKFRLLKLLKEMNYSYPNRCIASNCFYGLGSLSTLEEDFYDEGIVSIYKDESIEEKIKNVVLNINSIYIPLVSNFLQGNMSVIDDIFKHPLNFGYPVTTALAVCILNNRVDLFNSIIERSQNNKYMQEERNFLDDIILQLRELKRKYLNSASV